MKPTGNTAEILVLNYLDRRHGSPRAVPFAFAVGTNDTLMLWTVEGFSNLAKLNSAAGRVCDHIDRVVHHALQEVEDCPPTGGWHAFFVSMLGASMSSIQLGEHNVVPAEQALHTAACLMTWVKETLTKLYGEVTDDTEDTMRVRLMPGPGQERAAACFPEMVLCR